jgi:hypothetical protein
MQQVGFVSMEFSLLQKVSTFFLQIHNFHLIGNSISVSKLSLMTISDLAFSLSLVSKITFCLEVRSCASDILLFHRVDLFTKLFTVSISESISDSNAISNSNSNSYSNSNSNSNYASTTLNSDSSDSDSSNSGYHYQ